MISGVPFLVLWWNERMMKSSKQAVLDLMESARSEYRRLLTDPPTDDLDHRKRKLAADQDLEKAGTALGSLNASDYAAVLPRFHEVCAAVEEMDAQIVPLGYHDPDEFDEEEPPDEEDLPEAE